MKGGISELYAKIRDSAEYQKKYSYLMDGGLHEGKAGRGTFCDTTTSPQFKQDCMKHSLNGNSYSSSKRNWFEKLAGPWKNLKH